MPAVKRSLLAGTWALSGCCGCAAKAGGGKAVGTLKEAGMPELGVLEAVAEAGMPEPGVLDPGAEAGQPEPEVEAAVPEPEAQSGMPSVGGSLAPACAAQPEAAGGERPQEGRAVAACAACAVCAAHAEQGDVAGQAAAGQAEVREVAGVEWGGAWGQKRRRCWVACTGWLPGEEATGAEVALPQGWAA
jgi:hypothetical protein